MVSQELSEKLWKSYCGQGTGVMSYAYIMRIGDADVVAALALRVVLDGLSTARNYRSLVRNISSALEHEDQVLQLKEQLPYRHRVAQFWSQRGDKAEMGKVLRKALKTEQLKYTPWPYNARMQAGALLLELIRDKTGIIQFVTVRNPARKSFKKFCQVHPTPALLKWMEETNEVLSEARPFYLPIKEVPIDWASNEGGGYHDPILQENTRLVSGRFYQTMHKPDYSDMPEVYDAVNHVQRVGWEMNAEVYAIYRQLWDEGAPVAGMPAREDEPLPEKPETEDQEEIRQWVKARARIHTRNYESRCKRMKLSRINWIIDLVGDGAFYFPQYLDFRGRMYPRPIIFHPQADDLCRGLLRFAEGKPITDWEQAKWLAIHTANAWGKSKLTFEERIQWTVDNTARILACVKDGPLDDRWWAEAEDPWQFLAACYEWSKFKKAGYGYVSNLPIYMDGSNNGLQVFSFLLRDPVGGAATNCIPSPTPRDIYADVAAVATAKLIAVSGEESPRAEIAQFWLDFCGGALPREATKRPVMVLPYGGTLFSCKEYVREWAEELSRSRGRQVFTKDSWKQVSLLGDLIWESIGEVVVSAKVAMKWLQACSKAMCQQQLPLKWKAPSGFPVTQAYHQYKEAFIRLNYSPDRVKRIAWRRFTDRLDSREQRNGVSPNFIHSLDAAVMVKTVNQCASLGVQSISPIHDSFGVVAADIPILNRAVRETYAEVFSKDLLADFYDQLVSYATKPELLPVPLELGTMDVSAVVDSLYFSS